MRVDPVSGRVSSGPLEPVYVYEAPVRLWHWVTMLTIFVLGGDRLPDRQPAAGNRRRGLRQLLLRLDPDDPRDRGDVLVVAFLVRIYWAFVGNHIARSIFYLPFWSGAWWRGFWSQVALLPVPEEGVRPLGRAQPGRAGGDVLHVHAGHGVHDRHRPRALRRAVGLGHGLDARWFGWVFVVFGEPQMVRTLHHLAMWYLLLFAFIHMYMVFREDIMSGESIISTMVNGIRMFKREPGA